MSARKLRNTWWVDLTLGGNRWRRRAPVNTQEAAEVYERKLRAAFVLGVELPEVPAVKPPSVVAVTTFQEFSSGWFETYVKANNKPLEQRSKEYTLRLHLVPWFGTIPLDRIATLDIERYKAAKKATGLSAKTINNHLAILQKCLRSAQDWGVLDKLPKAQKLKTSVPRFDFFSPDESEKLARAGNDSRARAMVLLALRTGMRIGEILALEWRHVDLDRRLITVEQSIFRGVLGTPKSGRLRYIPITEELAEALLPERRSGGFVFGLRGGQARTHDMAYKALHRACDQAGLRRVGWHTLRHTFASQLAAASVPIPAVQQLLGHSTIAMTMRYAHVAPSSLHAAVSVLDRRAETTPVGQHFGQHSPITAIA